MILAAPASGLAPALAEERSGFCVRIWYRPTLCTPDPSESEADWTTTWTRSANML